MNGINSIRLDINSVKHDDLASGRRKIAPIPAIDSVSSTESEHKKKSKPENTQYSFDTHQFNSQSELLSTDSKFYRSGLLNEIYNKMSGGEARFKPGSFVEYFA